MFKPACYFAVLLIAAFLVGGTVQNQGQKPQPFSGKRKMAGNLMNAKPEEPKKESEPVKFLKFIQSEVTPAKRDAVTLFTHMGDLETTGYREIVLNLFGNTKAGLEVEGEIGIILVPDNRTVLSAMQRHARFLGALAISAKATRRNWSIFSAEQKHFKVGFPRYKVYAYNQTIRTARLELHVALSR